MPKRLFSNWPKPAPAEDQAVNRVTYSAPCACGRDAEWLQTGHAAAVTVEICCDCHDGDAVR